MNTPKVLGQFLYTILLLALILLGTMFVGTMVPIPGNYEIKVVQSGSMEPTLGIGSVVFIVPREEYRVGDVVTFGKDDARHVPTTHRIVEVSPEGIFTTQGDANEAADPVPVRPREVIGKVVFDIPYLGYVLQFARTPIGFSFLIGIPALIVVLDEFATIVYEIRKWRFKKRIQRERQLRERM